MVSGWGLARCLRIFSFVENRFEASDEAALVA
jgi:hypothetical protein